MFEDVESYLTNAIGADSASYLLEALRLLDDIDYQDHVFPLRNMMGDLDSHSLEENVGYIRSIIQDNYVLILKSMSVIVTDDVSLEKLYSLLFSLSKIEDYENKEELNSIIDNGNSPEEILAEFVKVFRLEDPDNTIEYIQAVSSDLIEKIHGLCQKELRTSQEGEYRDVRHIKENAKRFFQKYPGTFIRDLIASGYKLGQERDNYIKALEEHFSHFDPTVEQFAQEILGVVVVTSDEEIRNDSQALTETFVTDANEMIKVNSLMMRMIEELWPYEKE